MRWIRALAGCALLPAVPAAGRTLAAIAIAALPEARTLSWLGLGTGVLLWTIWSLLLPLPERGYILGHELTHAFWALCMGGRVGRMRVRRSGGFVELSKSNIWIALSPYFFPLYTWIILAAYGVCALFFDPVPGQPLWMAAVGWTWAFHITFTVRFLWMHQPDVREYGRLLSYSLITIILVCLFTLYDINTALRFTLFIGAVVAIFSVYFFCRGLFLSVFSGRA